MIHWDELEKLSPEEYKERLEHLLKRGYFSTQRSGNYSFLFNGKPFNYYFGGKELFLTHHTDAENLVRCFKINYTRKNVSPEVELDISYRREN